MAVSVDVGLAAAVQVKRFFVFIKGVGLMERDSIMVVWKLVILAAAVVVSMVVLIVDGVMDAWMISIVMSTVIGINRPSIKNESRTILTVVAKSDMKISYIYNI